MAGVLSKLPLLLLRAQASVLQLVRLHIEDGCQSGKNLKMYLSWRSLLVSTPMDESPTSNTVSSAPHHEQDEESGNCTLLILISVASRDGSNGTLHKAFEVTLNRGRSSRAEMRLRALKWQLDHFVSGTPAE